jgi:glycerol-3-phosphate dehydrogenase (NAD(P)+)
VKRAIAVLGAGAMGSALCTPLVARGHDVRLWGTWLDEHLLAACRAGQPHPRTGVALPGAVKVYSSDRLAAALDGAELVVLAVASGGVCEVTRRALPYLGGVEAVLLTSKGFAPDGEQVVLLPDLLRLLAQQAGCALPPVVAVGGPGKANEVAAGRPTAAVFDADDRAVAASCAEVFRTEAYRPAPGEDSAGVEVCAAMKNVYAIALGVCDGLAEHPDVGAGGQPYHDLKAATFARAATELAALAVAVGGHTATAYGLAGVGDLEVTGLSGRNKVYGVRIGRGEDPATALAAMVAAEQTVEGVAAAALARAFVAGLEPIPELPLLSAVTELLAGPCDAVAVLARAVLPG